MDIIISSWLLWLIIAAILVIIELLTSMIATFCLATGCLIAMVCALLDWGVEAQLIGAIIGTVIAFILVQTKRGRVISRFNPSYRYKHQRTLNTNCDKSRSVKSPAQKRIDSIDLFKGIAILGIVWKHTFHPQWCDLIHISAFLHLIGNLFQRRAIHSFLKKKIRTILIPFLFFYILSYLARMAFYFGHFRTLHGFAWDSLLETFSDYK